MGPGDPRQERHHFDLAIAARLLQNATHVSPYSAQRNAAIRSDVLHGLARRETARDARFSGRQIEQGLHELDRRRLRRRYGRHCFLFPR